MFHTILIANRGEIACRIARTARRLGIRTVGVYSEADAGALHVALCDEAHLIGPPAARESYLDAGRILAVARASGAEAIHPGYGFLSENAGFAEACAAAGVVFIGPPAAAIRAMGDKSRAKALMEQAGVPLVPGYHGEDQSPAVLAREAAAIGYPVLLKASAGGGGKGMRIVLDAAELEAAAASARREARAAFGDDRLLVERYLERPRHIEVQVFADTHGGVVHLFERDCSVQRRHQKVVEEAPAPGMAPARRREMGAAACAAARAIGYVGAGTVEFIADPTGNFHFMEMNTRLQVEHPVTEFVTGQDLVEWQLRVAAGEPLPATQEALEINGHAFEARIYAEDPTRDFLPATGTLDHLQLPAEDAHVRLDTGVRSGDTISPHYDPMLAKLIVWGEDRDDALRRLRRALGESHAVGVTTNLGFLRDLAAHPAFARGELDTGFIDRHRAELFQPSAPVPDRVLAIAALAELLRVEARAGACRALSRDPWSPWHAVTGWRLNDDNHHTLAFLDGEHEVTVNTHFRPGHYLLELPGGPMAVRGEATGDGAVLADLDGVRVRAGVVRVGETLDILCNGASHRLRVHDPVAATLPAEGGGGGLTAPMPGTIIAVLVETGEPVRRGAPLLVMEAMKMEHTITAEADGVVDVIRYAVGDQVQEGAELLVLETGEAADEPA